MDILSDMVIEKQHDKLFDDVQKAKTEVAGCSLTAPIIMFIVSIPLVLVLGLGVLTGFIAIIWGLLNLFAQSSATQQLIYARTKLDNFEEKHGYT